MTLVEFKLLDGLEQFEYYLEYAKSVGCRYDNDYKILLYKADDFYIEMHYSIATESLHKLIAISDTEMLDAYSLLFSDN